MLFESLSPKVPRRSLQRDGGRFEEGVEKDAMFGVGFDKKGKGRNK